MLDLRGHTVPTRQPDSRPGDRHRTLVRAGVRHGGPHRLPARTRRSSAIRWGWSPTSPTRRAPRIYAYLRTVPPIRNPLPKPPAVPAGGEKLDGKALYEQYGCVSCHGEDGIGIADLRRPGSTTRRHEALELWILDAPRVRPGTRMPGWRGVIHEEHLKPLMDHVLALGKTKS